MNPIVNYETYLTRMDKSIQDKLFFLEFLDNEVDTIVDYGCANGALGIALERVSIREYYGYDIDKKMLDKAMNNGISEYNLFYDFDKLLEEIDPSKTALVLSSVIHEVYSYSGEYGINEFWNRVFNSGFKQIIIRDMGLKNNQIAYGKVPPREANILTNRIYQDTRSYMPMVYFKDYYQLLLKYWYIENWDRESKENYFPITVSEVLEKIKLTDYACDYKEEFIVPFVANKVQEELDIFMPYSTHYKLVLTLPR